MKHSNISIFVPHNGCPRQCTFCNQKNITGRTCQPTADDVVSAVETALKSGVEPKNTEISFFGGSFTAVDREYMTSLLDATKPYIRDFYGIRCSTRPDAVDTDVLSLLKSYGVTSVELGAQSMCDDVLALNERGHTAADVVNSSRLIRKCGLSLGLQMMTGLYGSNMEKDFYTACEIAKLNPDTVRIYPTVTMAGTPLASLYFNGKYVPYTKEETISCCSKILKYYYDKDINVIRLGLHYSDNLVKNAVAGYYHPAFREICESRMFYDIIMKELSQKQGGSYTISVAGKMLSRAVGHKKCNVNSMDNHGYRVKFTADEALKNFEFRINDETR